MVWHLTLGVLLAPYAPRATLLAFGIVYSFLEYVLPLVVGLPLLPRLLRELRFKPTEA